MPRDETAGPIRETTLDERLRWGQCPECRAPHGVYCDTTRMTMSSTIISTGLPMAPGDVVHLARVRQTPMRVREVPVP